MQLLVPWLQPIAPPVAWNNDLFAQHGMEVAIARWDSLHPILGGNKVFKLTHFLQEAFDKKLPLVTAGGAYSNHACAIAKAGQLLNIPIHILIRGEEAAHQPSPVITWLKQQGATIYPVGRKEFHQLNAEIVQSLFPFPHCWVPSGGDSAKGEFGMAESIPFLPAGYDHWWVASGNGTTARGLHRALRERNRPEKVHGVWVVKGMPESTAGPIFHRADYLGRFGKSSKEILTQVREISKETGLAIEPVYTGKLLYYFLNETKLGNLSPGRHLLIHTGGLFYQTLV